MMTNFLLSLWFLENSFSKQTYLQDIGNPHQLPDGSLAYQNYTGSKNNRYNGPDAANKNNILVMCSISIKLCYVTQNGLTVDQFSLQEHGIPVIHSFDKFMYHSFSKFL